MPAGGEFPDEVRADGGGPEGDQTSKVVDVAGIGGICDEGGAHTKACTDEAVVDGRDSEEHGDGRVGGVRVAIGEAEDGDPFLDGESGFSANFGKAFLEGGGTA